MFPGLWCLIADVSEHCVCSIFIGEWISTHRETTNKITRNSNLILATWYCAGWPTSFRYFYQKSHTHVPSPLTCHMPRPCQNPCLDIPKIFCKSYQSRSYPLRSFLEPTVIFFFSPVTPTAFWKTWSHTPTPSNARDKVSHPNFSFSFKFPVISPLTTNITTCDGVMIMTDRDKINPSYGRFSVPFEACNLILPSELTLNNYTSIHDFGRGWKRVYVGRSNSDN
jgi:hypothetical protein